MAQQELIPHLFRTEFRKIAAVLCKHFGMEHLELAEDIAAETFLTALETWPYKGIPEQPVAWLYTVARNKARNQLNRKQFFTQQLSKDLKHQVTAEAAPDIDLSGQNIQDSQLQMLFALCHPSLAAEAQIGLALRILCGFGIDEIANAFLSNKETINKRLFRAREKLRQEKVAIALPPAAAIDQRLDTVLHTLYLLFSEGYYSESRDLVLREDLCLEAMRLVQLLLENEATDRPRVNALLALMCFHSSRFAARKDHNGAMILYEDQDETLWNRELIARGAYYLQRAATGTALSRYHLEAGIAYWHTIKEDSSEKWEQILQLYNRLLQLEYSPVAALNRTFALAKAKGAATAIAEAEQLQLNNNHYYFLLLGVLYRETDRDKSRQHLQHALELAVTQADQESIRRRLEQT